VSKSLLKRVAALEAAKRRTGSALSAGAQQGFEKFNEILEQFLTGNRPPIDYSKLDPNNPLHAAMIMYRDQHAAALSNVEIER
jgi:hypothetical protein